MRLIHTADWHLGRLFHGVHLTEDQAHVLDQLVELAADYRPDLLIVAGDVYDRAVPPPEAVRLLDDTLERLVLGLGLKVLLIAGNHDSPARLGFGAGVLARSGLFVAGLFQPEPAPVVCVSGNQTLIVQTLPYAEPAEVRQGLGLTEALDQRTALAARLARLTRPGDTRARTVLVAHALVAGGATSESERPLVIGGLGAVEPEIMSGFDFVALGHLHRAQSLDEGRIVYAGSPLKYSFSEMNDRKSVTLVEFPDQGPVRVERAALTPRRDLRRISGHLRDLLRNPAADKSREDYLLVSLDDSGPVFDAMGQLRRIYPNVLHLERPALISAEFTRPAIDHRRQTEVELLGAFFRQVTTEDLTGEEEAILTAIVDQWRQADRDG